MNSEDTINLLRHYRHDWMNQLQLLQGYSSMGKLDKVKDKLNDCITTAEQERKLTNLTIPDTALWIITFNWRYNNFRLNYDVQVSGRSLVGRDENLLNQLQDIMGIITTNSDVMEMYEGQLLFVNMDRSENGAGIQLTFTGNFPNKQELENQLLLKEHLHSVTIEEDKDEKIRCTIWIICN